MRGAVLVGLAAVLALAGCATEPNGAEPTEQSLASEWADERLAQQVERFGGGTMLTGPGDLVSAGGVVLDYPEPGTVTSITVACHESGTAGRVRIEITTRTPGDGPLTHSSDHDLECESRDVVFPGTWDDVVEIKVGATTDAPSAIAFTVG